MKLSGAKAVSIITGSLIFGLISWPTYVEGGPANSAQSVIDVSAFEWNLGGKQLRFVFERGNFALWDRSKWGRLEIGDRGNAPGKTILRGNLTALAIHGAPTSDLTGNLTPRDIAQFTIHSAENYGVILSGEFGPAESGGRNYLYFVDSDGRLAGFKYGFGSYTGTGFAIEKHGKKDPIYVIDLLQTHSGIEFPSESIALTYDDSLKAYRAIREAAPRGDSVLPLRNKRTAVKGNKILFPNGKEVEVSDLRSWGTPASVQGLQPPMTIPGLNPPPEPVKVERFVHPETATQPAQANRIEVVAKTSKKALSLSELENGISGRLERVEEFKFIQKEAKNLGVRAWLFGGTAAGYAHYVKWDLQRENGDPRFQPDRFDYDYTNIYRSTQDLDIVIDGDAKQAEALQNALMTKYPHLQGSKTTWEVRLLAQDMGDKLAILNNPDFMNQHTDSNSTGMIELTQPPKGESVVRDVRGWKSKSPYFLEDVHSGMLHYYFSPLHEKTKFAKEGRNPPIISVIRYLTKAFQYELELRPEDLAQIKKIIADFDPNRISENSYAPKWIEKNGKKLIQNAVNIEYAWNTLEQLGLRKKLIAIRNNSNAIESLAWWMGKEPLRSKDLGKGRGKTAKELGLDIVAHETSDFHAYESITRAHTGDPNVLISRKGSSNEGALYGDGFYTKEGREGARATGFTIRFHLDPNARENTDFIRVPEKNFVIITNKAALKVIPESLNIGPVDFFHVLAQSDSGIANSDKGILERLKRRIAAKSNLLSETVVNGITDILKSKIQSHQVHRFSPILSEWFALPISEKHPEIVETLIKNESMDEYVIEELLSKPHPMNRPEFVELFLKRGTIDGRIAASVLSKPHWVNHPELVEKLLEKGTADVQIAFSVLSEPHWKKHPELVEQLIKKGTVDKVICQRVLSQPHWKDHPEFVEQLLNKGTVDSEIVIDILSQPHWQDWKDFPKWVEQILKNGKADRWIVSYVLADPRWKDHPEWLEYLLRKGTVDDEIARYALPKTHWQNHPGLRRLLNGAEPTVENLRAAFKRGQSIGTSHSRSCLLENLSQSLL